MGLKHCSPVVCLLSVLGSFASVAHSESVPVVDYPTNPDVVVASFAERLGEVGEAEPGPRMQVHGDGLVLVTYPSYMKRAGSYTLRLRPEETAALLESLLTRGLAEFDAPRVQRQRAAAEAANQRGTAGAPLFYSSDPSLIQVGLRVDRYASADGRSTANEVNRTISWAGLADDVRRHPDLTALQDLAAAVAELRTLMERPDLIEVD